MRKLLLAIALICLFSMPLFAQDLTKAEAFGGLAFHRMNGDGSVGLVGALEGNINNTYSVVGELGVGFNEGQKSFTFMGGPRISYREVEKVRIFGEFLVGGFAMTGNNGSGFALAFGGGLDYSVTDKISLRPVQFDFIKGHDNGWTPMDYRYAAGIVFKLGGSK